MCLIVRRVCWRGGVGGERHRRVSVARALESSVDIEASWRHVSRITFVHAFHPWPARPELSDTYPLTQGPYPSGSVSSSRGDYALPDREPDLKHFAGYVGVAGSVANAITGRS